jgi:hypothetical protein
MIRLWERSRRVCFMQLAGLECGLELYIRCGSLLFDDPLLSPKPIKFFLVGRDHVAIREDEDVLVA